MVSLPEIAMVIILILVVAIVGCAIITPQVTNAVSSLFSPVAVAADGGQPTSVQSPYSGVVLYQCDGQPVQEQKIAEISSMFRFGNQITVPAGCKRNILLAKDYHATEDSNSDGSVLVGIWPGSN